MKAKDPEQLFGIALTIIILVVLVIGITSKNQPPKKTGDLMFSDLEPKTYFFNTIDIEGKHRFNMAVYGPNAKAVADSLYQNGVMYIILSECESSILARK